MENAHERFGWLEFTRVLKDTTARVRLRLDRMVAEMSENGREGQFHLLSVIGGDSDVGAVWAAVQQNQVFKVTGPSVDACLEFSLGEKSEWFRGSISVLGLKRPVRHLVAVSVELAATRLGAATVSNHTILCDDDPVFVLYRLSERFGLPVVPEWAGWFTAELRRRKAITSLTGIGCRPILISGTKSKFLAWISRGLRRGMIKFPEANGPLRWPQTGDSFTRAPGPASEVRFIPQPAARDPFPLDQILIEPGTRDRHRLYDKPR
ncbi:MAG TPA: hypothetical protein VGX94_01800 [Terriglobia bacterium]|nr:hypothetical protein [Terriglobia bacterium]